MTEPPALSTLARKALDVLKEGGEFRYALETNSYSKREQFRTRLKKSRGVRCEASGSSPWTNSGGTA
jgi:hypothetical protein